MNVAVTIIDSIPLPGGFSTVAIDVPECGVHEVVDIGFDPVFEAFGVPDAISLDLMLVASIAYVCRIRGHSLIRRAPRPTAVGVVFHATAVADIGHHKQCPLK